LPLRQCQRETFYKNIQQLCDQGGPDPKRRASSIPGQNQPIGSPPPKPAGQPADASKPLEKGHCDSIVNYLLRLACQVSDALVSML